MEISSNRRRAFTATELLFVVISFNVIAAITLPVLQDVRERGRQTECTNNLKVLAIACHNYHDVWRSMPFMRGGTITSDGEMDPLSSHLCLSGMVSLTPFIEEMALYDSAAANNFGPVPWRNCEWWDTQIGYLLCPSDEFERGDIGDSNYRFVVGTTVIDNHGFEVSNNNGMFGNIGTDEETRTRSLGHTVSFGEVNDGLSNTVMLAERRNAFRKRTNDIAWIAAGVEGIATNPRDALEACMSVSQVYDGKQYDPRTDVVSLNPGSRWSDGRPYFSGITTVVPPNGPSCIDGDDETTHGVFTTSSMHPDLVFVALADGSVRSITNDVDVEAWWALGTRDGEDDVEAIFHE